VALVLVVVGGVVWLVRPRPAVPRKSERQPRSGPPARVNRKRPPRRGPWPQVPVCGFDRRDAASATGLLGPYLDTCR